MLTLALLEGFLYGTSDSCRLRDDASLTRTTELNMTRQAITDASGPATTEISEYSGKNQTRLCELLYRTFLKLVVYKRVTLGEGHAQVGVALPEILNV